MLTSELETELDALRSSVLKCVDDDDWQVVKRSKKNGLQVTVSSKPSTEFRGKIFMGEGHLNARPEDCFFHCDPKPNKSRASWDTSIKELQMINAINVSSWPEAYIMRTMTHSALMGAVSSRDFVDMIFNVNDERMVGTLASNKETDLCPPSKGYVRGENYYCGIMSMRVPDEPQKTRLVYIAHSDIKGNLPVSILESVIPYAIISFFSGLKDQLSKAGQLR